MAALSALKFPQSAFIHQCSSRGCACCHAANWAGVQVQIRISGLIRISGCGGSRAGPGSAAAPPCAAAALPSCGRVSVAFGEISAEWNQRTDACPHRCVPRCGIYSTLQIRPLNSCTWKPASTLSFSASMIVSQLLCSMLLLVFA